MKKIKFPDDFFASGNTMIGQNQRGLVFLSITTIVKKPGCPIGSMSKEMQHDAHTSAPELVLCEGAEITLCFCFTGLQPLY